MSTPSGSRFWAILRQRCPRCRAGRVFRGLVDMNPSCPVCGLPFEREQGYFLGPCISATRCRSCCSGW